MAASCGKAIIPLPRRLVIEVDPFPSTCPPNTEQFRRSRALLEAAMKKKAIR
jgi:hypothetical protein